MRKLSEKVKSLPSQTLAERMLYCAGMLHIYGLMTSAERMKVHARMMKLKAKQAARGAKP